MFNTSIPYPLILCFFFLFSYAWTDNLEQASVDTLLTPSNLGYSFLQKKMGWKGKGLGEDEQGNFV